MTFEESPMRPFLYAAFAAAMLVTPVAAQNTVPAPMTAETMWGMARIGDPDMAPDGRHAVVAITRFDIKENRGSSDLWLYPVAGGAPRQLTTHPASDSAPTFSPDGQWIAFLSRRGDDKANQVYVIPVDGGEAVRVTNVATGASAPRWFPDSNRIAFISRVWSEGGNFDDQGRRLKERDDSKMTARTWDAGPIWFWDHFIDERDVHLFITDRTGAAPTSPTRGSGASLDVRDPGAGSFDISPDGREIAFVSQTGPSNRPNWDIFTVPTAGGQAINITPNNPAPDMGPRYSPNGRFIAYGQRTIYGFYADRAALMVRDRASGAVRELAPGWDRSATNYVWTPDSSALFSAIDDAATNRIYRFDVRGGTPRAVTGANDFGAISVGGRPLAMVAVRQSFSEPPTLVRVNPITGQATKLSTVNDEALATFSFGKVESVTYKGANNADIQMWVVYPPNFDPSKKYPAFLLLHGGPHNAITDTWTWRWNAHVFAGWGYVVAWHNFHGSSGFGQNFTDSINPDWATLPYEDTIKAAEWLKSRPSIDGERMVAGGGSYGGYLASILLGRPNPFKALIAHAAVYNSFTQIANDGGHQQAREYEFWENPQAFAARSPHTAAANFTTPTLVIHGQLDYRVPVNHGFELFNTLQKRGVDSRLVYYPDENHWILKPQNSIHWYKEVRAWIERYAPPGGKGAAAAGR
jgi:dipeptidyl aminopeptidase/acylaminoacyl peptidase